MKYGNLTLSSNPSTNTSKVTAFFGARTPVGEATATGWALIGYDELVCVHSSTYDIRTSATINGQADVYVPKAPTYVGSLLLGYGEAEVKVTLTWKFYNQNTNQVLRSRDTVLYHSSTRQSFYKT